MLYNIYLTIVQSRTLPYLSVPMEYENGQELCNFTENTMFPQLEPISQQKKKPVRIKLLFDRFNSH